jgi:NADH-quinone oxidoreductase subunit G
VIIGSREDKVYRYEPRENEAVNSSWMCDYGRLNYKWIGRSDRLAQVLGSKGARLNWPAVLKEITDKLKQTPRGSAALIASARQTNEELYMLAKLAARIGAMTDSVPRSGESDKLLLNADRNPNSRGAQLIGISAAPMGANLSKIVDGIRSGAIKTLIVFGEDVTKAGIDSDLLGKLDTLIVSDILPNATSNLAHYLLPGCAHAEKRGTFTNTKGRVQKFMKAVEAPGDARAEWEFLHELVFSTTGQNGFANIESLFNQMAAEVPAFQGLTWAGIGDLGVSIPI